MSQPRVSRLEKNKYKIIIVGDLHVGKTSLLNQFVGRTFQRDIQPTMSADYVEKIIEVEGIQKRFQIWDTAGQERYLTNGPIFYQNSDCCVLVYDTTNAKSFENLETWRDEFIINSKIQKPEKFPFVVIGTKADDLKNRKVSIEEATAFCQKLNNAPLFELSNQYNEQVEIAFQGIAKLALQEPDWIFTPTGESILLHNPDRYPPKYKCCT